MIKSSRGQIFLWSILLLNIFVTIPLKAQFFSTGSDPARARWRQISTPNFKIIYPLEIDSLARRYAFLAESYRSKVMEPLNANPSRVDVVLHPYNAISNGMVAVAPRRVELITRPSWDNRYYLDWHKHLVIHELRHLGQVNRFKRGIFRPLSWLIGEQSFAIGIGLYMNTWKLEGDAIVAETELTPGGRGRDPDHLLYYRAAFLNGDYRNWQRWTLGSYREFVPDVYSFGYLMNSFVRVNSGNYQYMEQVTKRVVDRFYNPWEEARAYRDFTGLTKDENFEELKRVMTARWQREDSVRAPFTPSTEITREQKEYTEYVNPVSRGDDTLYALKTDMKRIRRLVKIDKQRNETNVRYMGRVSSPFIRVGENLLWTEFTGSPRWEMESFSDIYSYNIESRKTTRHTRGQTYYSLFECKQRQQIIAVSYLTGGESKIVFLNGETFLEEGEIGAPVGGQLFEVVRLKDNLFAIALTRDGYGIYRYDLPKQEWSPEIPGQSRAIKNLRSDGDALFFISDLQGKNDVYHYDPQIKFLRLITNSRFGVKSFNITSCKSNLIYSDFGQSGYNLVSVSQEEWEWKPASFNNAFADEFAEILSLQAAHKTVPENDTTQAYYQSKPYRKIGNILNIHSWAPFYYNIDNIKTLSYESIYDVVTPGFVVYSQNSLSTAFAFAGYSYRNGFHSGHLKFTYRGLYPVFELRTDFNARDRQVNTIIREPGKPPYRQRDTITGSPFLRTQLLAYVPLSYNSGGWFRGIIPRVLWRYTNDSYYSSAKEKFSDYQYINAGVNLYSIRGMSVRDIFPRLGIGLSVQFATVPNAGENFGSLLYSSMYAYLPGFAENHALRLSVDFQKQFFNNKSYLMSNFISFPRGVEARYSTRAELFQAEYAMPLFTGDLSLTPLLYLKRIQIIPYAGYCRNVSGNKTEKLLSTGGDVVFDVNLIGISYPLTIGFRGGYTSEKSSYFEFLFKTPL